MERRGTEPFPCPGKAEWQPVLQYTAALHQRSTHPPTPPFPAEWEEIGPGYCYGPAFGHWDIVHQAMDAIPFRPEHAKRQLLNNLAAQHPDGLVPGSIWLRNNEVRWRTDHGHPPVWPVAVQEYFERYGDLVFVAACYEPLVRQIGWFNAKRKAEEEGYYYTDILNHRWESGVDDGIRFDQIAVGPFACIDATSHVYQMYRMAETWADLLGKPAEARAFAGHADRLQAFIRERLYDRASGFFYDIWAVDDAERRHIAHEGLWPIIVGAAAEPQAMRVIDDYLLSPDHFFSEHPIPTLSLSDPGFELRMWRGPAWNSITLWAAKGCLKYGRADAAVRLLERSLDATARQYAATGTIWEFYHPRLGRPEEVQRKAYTEFNIPCRDYLGHNPLLAMAALWEACR